MSHRISAAAVPVGMLTRSGAQIFTTVHHNQTELAVLIYQGESSQASKNRMLGQFQLVNLPPARAGQPQIEVCTMSLSVLQLMHVLSTRGWVLHAHVSASALQALSARGEGWT